MPSGCHLGAIWVPIGCHEGTESHSLGAKIRFLCSLLIIYSSGKSMNLYHLGATWGPIRCQMGTQSLALDLELDSGAFWVLIGSLLGAIWVPSR